MNEEDRFLNPGAARRALVYVVRGVANLVDAVLRSLTRRAAAWDAYLDLRGRARRAATFEDQKVLVSRASRLAEAFDFPACRVSERPGPRRPRPLVGNGIVEWRSKLCVDGATWRWEGLDPDGVIVAVVDDGETRASFTGPLWRHPEDYAELIEWASDEREEA